MNDPLAPLRRPVRWLLRIGLATKGFVYCAMGTLALLAALGQRGGAIADKQHTVRTLRLLPGGRVLLALIAIGLLAYVLLRVAQGLFDTEQKGSHAKGVLRRLGYVVNGLLYVGLVTYCAHGAWAGHVGPDGSEEQRSLAARMLRLPGGGWLFIVMGGVIIGAGLYAMSQSLTHKFLDTVDTDELGERRTNLIRRAGRFGYLARGLVMVIIGGFFCRAGSAARAAYIGNAEDALDLLAHMGPLVLGAVAFGLAAYGVFAILQSLYPAR